MRFYHCEKTMTMATITEENIYCELVYRIRDLVHYHRGGSHGGMQADKILEKELRVLCRDQQAAERERDWT